MDCSPPGSSAHGISQARTLEWVAISSSRGPSQLRGQSCVAYIDRWVLYHWATREAPFACLLSPISILTYTEADKIISVFQRQIWMPFYEITFIVWRREWQPTSPFLPGEFHGQRSLAGYSSWGHKESDMTERLSLSHSKLAIHMGLICWCDVSKPFPWMLLLVHTSNM